MASMLSESTIMTTLFKVPSDQLAEFCRRWKVAELALFGSALREDYRSDSDVDVLVTFSTDAPIGVFEIAEMKAELEKIFGRRVDLVEKAALRNPFRRAPILRSAREIYVA
jgi:uncharacterized protein